MNKAKDISIGKIENNSFEWYVPHYKTNFSQQAKLSEQFLSKLPTGLRYVERSVFRKEINTQNIWNFELGTQEGINVPIWMIVTLQQSDTQYSQNINNDTFYRFPVLNVHCIIGVEKYPYSAIPLYYGDDIYSQGNGQIKEAFRVLTKGDILQRYISDLDFRSSDESNDIGCNIHVFHIRYQKNL